MGGRRRRELGDEIQAGMASTESHQGEVRKGNANEVGEQGSALFYPRPQFEGRARPRTKECPRAGPRARSQHHFPASVSLGVPVKGIAVVRGAAGPSLCLRARPVEPTPRHISPAGRYRSGPAKLDTRGLQPILQRS